MDFTPLKQRAVTAVRRRGRMLVPSPRRILPHPGATIKYLNGPGEITDNGDGTYNLTLRGPNDYGSIVWILNDIKTTCDGYKQRISCQINSNADTLGFADDFTFDTSTISSFFPGGQEDYINAAKAFEKEGFFCVDLGHGTGVQFDQMPAFAATSPTNAPAELVVEYINIRLDRTSVD